MWSGIWRAAGLVSSTNPLFSGVCRCLFSQGCGSGKWRMSRGGSWMWLILGPGGGRDWGLPDPLTSVSPQQLLSPQPKFRSPSDDGSGGVGDDGQLSPGVLVRCASGPPPRTPRPGPPPATRSPHLTARSGTRTGEEGRRVCVCNSPSLMLFQLPSDPSLWNPPAAPEPGPPPLLPPKKDKMRRKVRARYWSADRLRWASLRGDVPESFLCAGH